LHVEGDRKLGRRAKWGTPVPLPNFRWGRRQWIFGDATIGFAYTAVLANS
jgi:hypothetical protein